MTEGKNTFEAGETPRMAIRTTEAINECVERLFLACQRSLRVRAGRLDLDFYHSETFTRTCQSIITRDMRSELLFLVEDEQHVMKTNSRLVALARQFSSYVKLRVIPKEYIERQEMFVLRDTSDYLHQPSSERPTALFATSDRGMVRQFRLRFDELWERSSQPAELFTAGL